MSTRVTLIGRPGCHLCAQARDVVAAVTSELRERFDEHDITVEADLYERYWDKIPVVVVDGRELAFYRVGQEQLRAALTAPPA